MPSHSSQKNAAHEDQASSTSALINDPRTPNPVSIVVLDLDQSLVNSRGVHLQIFRALLGDTYEVDQSGLELASSTYNGLRGSPYSEIFQVMHSTMLGHSQLVPQDQASFERDFLAVVKSIGRGEIQLDPAPSLIPGAERLMQHFRSQQTQYALCTGSPRFVADMLLEVTGLRSHFSTDQIHCSGDPHLSGTNKHDTAYWHHSGLADHNLQRAVAFDDHPHSAGSILTATEIPLLCLRINATDHDSAYFEALRELQQEFGERLRIVRDWGELLS